MSTKGTTTVSQTVRWILLSASIGGALVARAQGADSGELTEVIVTAQKREQDLQSVPISIQALTSEKLDELQARNFADYVQFLPSVSFTNGSQGIPGNRSVVFRGIATDGGLIASGTLPTVGSYLDEQPITSISGAVDIHLYDVARVEALAGPQGTLFGASSQAGTLRIITNKPDASQFSASYDLEVNKILLGGPGGSFEGYVNVPLVADKIALRAVGWYNHTGGYISNVFRARRFPSSGITQNNTALLGNDLNDTDVYGLRAQLGIDLDDNWTVTPSVIAQRTTWDGSFRSDDTKAGELNVAHYFPEFGRDSWYQAGLTVTGKVADFDIVYAGYYMDRKRADQVDYSDYGFYYDAIAGSGTGVVDNLGNMIDPSQLNTNNIEFDKMSHELRVASPEGRRVRGIAGLFFQTQTELGENNYLTPGFATRLSVPGRPGQVWLTKQERIDRDRAIFGQLDFDLTDKWTATAGVRAYEFDNTLVGFYGVNTTYFGTGVRQCLGPRAGVGPYGVGAAVVPGTPCTNLGVLNSDGSISPKQSKGSGTTWRLNGTYKFNEDHLIYATVSTGFRPGGINRAGAAMPFDADKLTNYEIGTKNSFQNRRTTLNLTVFQGDWKDVQVTYQAPGASGVAQITNAGGARARGVEADFALRTGSGFTWSGAVTYVDATLTAPLFTGSPIPSAPNGQRLPLTPKFKASLVGRYEFAFGNSQAHAQLAASYTGDRNPVLVTRDLAKTGILPSYLTLDATLGRESGNSTLELYVRNLTDERGQQSRGAECNINYCGPSTFDPVGQIYRIYIQPRTIGLRFGQKF